MPSLGADEVLDYTRYDFTRTPQPYDLVLDLVAHGSVYACRRDSIRPALTPEMRLRIILRG